MMGYVYEGSGSDDSDTYVTSGRAAIDLGAKLGVLKLPSTAKPSQNRSEGESRFGSSQSQLDPYHIPGSIHNDDFDFSTLTQGQIAPENELFVPFQLVKKYPYMFIEKGGQPRVADAHFTKGKLYDRVWDFSKRHLAPESVARLTSTKLRDFYVYRLENEANTFPIALVPTSQLYYFLAVINQDLGTNLTIPSGNNAFSIMFTNDGTPQPRYLGRTRTQTKATILLDEVPPRNYVPSFEKKLANPSQAAIDAFKDKINLMTQAQKASKNAKREENRKNQVKLRKDWGESIKRVQRYIGVRQRSPRLTALENYTWTNYQEAVNAGGKAPPTRYDPMKVAPFDQEKDAVFVCVDIESYERAHGIITEIGIATLDTRDVAKVIPGEDGGGYRNIIRARHFRILEHSNYRNTDFVQDCPDKFEYGTSEWISIKDAPAVIASCFKYPYSDFSAPIVPRGEEAPKRNIVLVGHDLQSDVEYMRNIGYNVYNLACLVDHVDTKDMWQYVTRDPSPRKLVAILAELNLTGWYPHNAGNDAVYTLHAMLGTAIKHLQDRSNKSEWKKEVLAQSDRRITNAMEQAREVAQQGAQGWSSYGEGSDGGSPVKPSPIIKKGAASAAETPPKFTAKPITVESQIEMVKNRGTAKYAAMNTAASWDFNEKPAGYFNSAGNSPRATPATPMSGARTRGNWEEDNGNDNLGRGRGKITDNGKGGDATLMEGMGGLNLGGKKAWKVNPNVEKIMGGWGLDEIEYFGGGSPDSTAQAKTFVSKSSTPSKSVLDGGWGLTDEEKNNLRDDINWTNGDVEELLRLESPESPKARKSPSWGRGSSSGYSHGW